MSGADLLYFLSFTMRLACWLPLSLEVMLDGHVSSWTTMDAILGWRVGSPATFLPSSVAMKTARISRTTC